MFVVFVFVYLLIPWPTAIVDHHISKYY